VVQWYIIARTDPYLLSQHCLFHETLDYEWLYNFNVCLDPEDFNPRLTEWLIEYNFNRLHQSLAYLTPVEYIEKELAKIRKCYLCGQLAHGLLMFYDFVTL